MSRSLRSKDSSSSLRSAVSWTTSNYTTTSSAPTAQTPTPSQPPSFIAFKDNISRPILHVTPSNSIPRSSSFASSTFSPYLSYSHTGSTAKFASSTRTFRLAPPILPAYHPTTLRQGWHYTFREGDNVWACLLDVWRLGRVCEEGREEVVQGRRIICYTITWTKDGLTYRGRFSPSEGTLKPNTERIRQLLEEEKAKILDHSNTTRNSGASERVDGDAENLRDRRSFETGTAI